MLNASSRKRERDETDRYSDSIIEDKSTVDLNNKKSSFNNCCNI